MAWILASLVAIAILFFGARAIVKEHAWLKGANIASGQVVANVPYRRGKTGRKVTRYRPQVEFYSQDGSFHSFEDKEGASPPEFWIGQRVTVAYDNAPDNARIVTFGRRYGTWVFLVGVGVLILLLRIVFLVGNRLVPSIYLAGNSGS